MKKFTILTVLSCLTVFVFAQNADEENIKKILQKEADAYFTRNLEVWKTNWKQDANVSNTFISANGSNTTRGWDSLHARVQRDFKNNPQPDFAQIKYDNYTINSYGNMALVDYDMMITPKNASPSIFPYTPDVLRYHNYQMLVKEDDQWKTTSRIVTLPDTKTGNPEHDIESDLNDVGYQLIAAKKLNEAIEIFKMNVKLYPASWNTYDSLGEAYAMAGDKKKAIENYEKSVKLNPKSESGPTALVKLKEK